MSNFYELEDYTFEDLESLISNEVEESIHLDFKDGQALDKNENKKKEISKDVSAFANSDGGIIIYGISEENHKAAKFSFINGHDYTKEWLEQIINSSIQRRIPDLKIFPLRKNGNIQETVYIVKIPVSIESPHLNRDKRFYKRFNFESVQMEEYEIRQLYGRKLKSELSIQSWRVAEIKTDEKNSFKFRVEVDIQNVGDITESTYKLNFYFNNFNSHLNVSWPQSNSHYNYTRMEDKRVKLSASSICPIFPNETINALRFELSIKKDSFFEAIENVKTEIVLFYENGNNFMESTLKDMTKNLVVNLHKNLEGEEE